MIDSLKTIILGSDPFDSGGDIQSRLYYNAYYEETANWRLPSSWIEGGGVTYFDTLRLDTQGIVRIQLSADSPYFIFAGSAGPHLITEIEENAVFTVESTLNGVTHSITIIGGTGSDSDEPYEWAPSNTQEVIDFVNTVRGQGTDPYPTATLIISYHAPVDINYETDFEYNPNLQLDAQITSLGDIDYETEFEYNAQISIESKLSIIPLPKNTVGFITLGQTQNFLNAEYSRGGDSLETLSMFVPIAEDYEEQFAPANEVVQNHISSYLSLSEILYKSLKNENIVYEALASAKYKLDAESRNSAGVKPRFFGFLMNHESVTHAVPIDYEAEFEHTSVPQFEARVSALGTLNYRTEFNHNSVPQFQSRLIALGHISYRSSYNYSPVPQLEAQVSVVEDIDYRAIFNYNSSPILSAQVTALGTIEFRTNFEYTAPFNVDSQFHATGDIEYRSTLTLTHNPSPQFDAQITALDELNYTSVYIYDPNPQIQSRLVFVDGIFYRSVYANNPNPIISAQSIAHSHIQYRAYFNHTPSPFVDSTLVAGQEFTYRANSNHNPNPQLAAQLQALGGIDYTSLLEHSTNPQFNARVIATKIVDYVAAIFHSPNPLLEARTHIFSSISYEAELHYTPDLQFDINLIISSELDFETPRGKPVPSTTKDPKGLLIRSFRVGIAVRMREDVKDNFWLVVGGNSDWNTYARTDLTLDYPIADSNPPDPIRSQRAVSSPLVAVRATCDYVINDPSGEIEHGIGAGNKWTILNTAEEARQKYCHHLLFRGMVDGDIITQDVTFRQAGFYSGLIADEDYKDKDILLARQVKSYGFLESLIFRKPIHWDAGASQFSASVILIAT